MEVMIKHKHTCFHAWLQTRCVQLLLALSICLSSLQGAQADPKNVQPLGGGEQLFVVSHGDVQDPFWLRVKKGAEMAAQRMDVKLTYLAPKQFDMQAMASLIEQAVAQSPAGLVVSIPDSEALAPAIRKAVAAGVPVVSMNSGAAISHSMGALFHVGPNEYAAGISVGRKLKGQGIQQLICVVHEMGSEALQSRCKGIKDGFGGSMKVIGTVNETQEAYATIKAVLQANPAIDGIVALGAETVAEPILAILEELNRDSMVFVTFDLSDQVLRAVKKGKIAFAVDQQPLLQGYLPVVNLALYHRYQVLPGADVPTGPSFVTQDNADKVRALSRIGLR